MATQALGRGLSALSPGHKACPSAFPAPDIKLLWRAFPWYHSVMDLLHGHLFLLKAGWGTGEEGVMSSGGI